LLANGFKFNGPTGTGANGSGNGSVNYSVSSNTGPNRTGTLTIEGNTFTVSQNLGIYFSVL
jgi:hypothetical protein